MSTIRTRIDRRSVRGALGAQLPSSSCSALKIASENVG